MRKSLACIGMTQAVTIYENGWGVDREMFYNSGLFAVVPMDYYFPGTEKSGDLPPRKGFAEKWHKRTLAFAPNIELHILAG